MKDVQFGELPSLKFDDWLYSCLYSPDGSSFAVVLSDNTINVYATSIWERTWILNGHSDYIISIAYSPNGDRIVSGSYDRTVRVWDVATGDCLYIYIGHAEDIFKVAYSPQDNVVASLSYDCTIRLWNVETGGCHSIISGCGNIYGMSFSPKGDHIAFSSSDRRVRLWDIDSRECRSILIGHSKRISSITYSGDASGLKSSPKRNQIASCSSDSTIRLWDAETGLCSRTLIGHSQCVNDVSYSPSEDHLVSCSGDGTIRLWDVESGTCRHKFMGHTDAVSSVVFSPRGDQVASISNDKTARLWNVETGECQHVLVHDGDPYVLHVLILSGGACVNTVTYSPQGNQVASCGQDKAVRLWDAETGLCQRTLTGHYWDVKGVAYSPNGNQIASASQDRTVRLWDATTGLCSHIFIGHRKEVTRVVYSPRGDQVASASYSDKTIRLWDTESGECRHTLAGLEREIDAIAYSPRGNVIVSWSSEGEGRMWVVETGHCCWSLNYGILRGSTRYTLSHPFAWMSPDTDSFITGDQDGSVRVWDVVGEGDQCRVHMRWRSTSGQFAVENACVQDVQGLSYLNRRLLKQGGAVGEPIIRLRETSKKVVSMASVVSKLKSPSSNTEALR
ncbi:MAG: WD40-repeat-containing domain protein [Benniella sp.]|nr:MAG: WD40-repeat-containing domain protein [Benniella sp.]